MAFALAGGAQAEKVLYHSFGAKGSLGGQFGESSVGNIPGLAVNQAGAGGAGVGDLYFSDNFNNRIERFDFRGNFIAAWGFDVIQPGKPGDLGTSVYEICTVAADCQAGINSVSPAPGGELASPRGVAINQQTGNVYVFNRELRRVEVFDAIGNFLRAWGQDVVSSGPGDTGTGFEVCVAANGDACKTGTSTGLGGSLDAATNFGGGVAVAPPGSPNAGNVVIADTGRNRVQEFTSAGAFVRTFGFDVVKPGGTVGSNVNETQTITLAAGLAGGTFTLTFSGQTTTPIASNAPAATVDQRLEDDLANIGAGDVSVTGAAGGPYTVTFTGALADADVAQITAAPASLAVGTQLTCSSSTTAESGTFQWLENGAPIAGATNSTYTVVPGDAGKAIQCRVVKTNSNAGSTQVSNPAAVIATPSGPLPTAPTSIAALTPETPNVGTVVTCNAGTWGNAPTSYTYTWLKNGTQVLETETKATTSDTYTLVAGDVPSNIQCLVAATNANGSVSKATRNNVTAGFSGPAPPPNNFFESVDVGVPLPGGSVATTQQGSRAFEICTIAADCKAAVEGFQQSAVGQFGTSGPREVAVDSTGAIYTVESSSIYRVQKFTPQVGPPALSPSVFAGALLTGSTDISGVGVAADNVSQIVVDPVTDDIYVAKGVPSANERQILQIDSAGTEILDRPVEGAGFGALDSFAVNPANGRVYVAEATLQLLRAHLFIDLPGHSPTVTTGDTSPGTHDYTRTLEGTVNPEEFKTTECFFEYGTTTDYGRFMQCTPSAVELGDGTSPIAISAETEPLNPETTYHYRLVARNPGKFIGRGEDRTFTSDNGPISDACPNAAIRAGQGFGVSLLPDCMALEHASPRFKNNQSARLFAAAIFSVGSVGGFSPDGERLRFAIQDAVADSPALRNAFGDPYVATRDAQGQNWSIKATTARVQGEDVREGGIPQAFSEDFSSWIHVNQEPFGVGISRIFRGTLGADGEAEPLSPLLTATNGAPEAGVNNSNLLGASADHSHVYIYPVGALSASYLPGDPTPAGFRADHNTYVAKLDSNGDPSVELIARDADGKVWGGNCGARLGGSTAAAAQNNKGSISPDGTRTYFSTRPGQPASGDCDSFSNRLRVLERVETPAGPEVSELISSECDRVANLPAVPACGTTAPSGTPVPDGDDVFQGASVDGTKVFFTTVRQLASTDLDAGAFNCEVIFGFLSDDCDLYLYDSTKPAGQRLTQVSAGDGTDATPGADAEVKSVVSVSGDGSHVYFIAKDVLTTNPGPEGKVAQAGQPNVYLYERSEDHPSGHLSFVATLAGDFFNSETVVGTSLPMVGEDSQGDEIGGDGHRLLFSSKAALTADDTDASRTDIFRYDAETEQIVRISKGAPDGVDNGPFNAIEGAGADSPTSPDYTVNGRWGSEDGETIVFVTAEPLLPGDNNKAPDSYMWRDGQIYRLPGTGDPTNTLKDRPIVSMDGDSVAFQSYAQLLPTDGDFATDVYVARTGGGFPVTVPPVPCHGEACQSPSDRQPGDESPASSTFGGPGNVQPQPASQRCPKGKRKVRRAGKARCVNKKAKKHAKKAQRNRDAKTNRRAAK